VPGHREAILLVLLVLDCLASFLEILLARKLFNGLKISEGGLHSLQHKFRIFDCHVGILQVIFLCGYKILGAVKAKLPLLPQTLGYLFNLIQTGV